MKIGFITNCLAWAGCSDIEDIVKWAVDNKFEDLEIGPGIPLDEKCINNLLDKNDIKISSFIYCRNVLSDDKEEAKHHIDEIKKRIEFAPKIGADKIICTTGVNNNSIVDNNRVKYDPEACLSEFIETFKEIIELAEKKNVKICLESCPIMNNISISPYMWDIIFDKIKSDKLGLAFDPSHFVWEFINPYKAILKYGNKIFDFHGKDCEVNYEKLSEIGILHNFSKTIKNDGVGENEFTKMWWRYRLVGNGDLNWKKIIANLEEVGYDGTITIEHEDPVWEGTLEKVKIGLLKSKKYLKNIMD